MIGVDGLGALAVRLDARAASEAILTDGPTLAEHMIDLGVGVTETARYVLHNIDADYFEEQ